MSRTERSEAQVWITSEVELPQAVIDAHTAARLVFFVGAGASMGPPASLPSFKKLARDLASIARVPFNDPGNLDRFLGSMPANFDVHTHARNLIAREGSMPNSTHTAVVRVAASIGPLRIVTTNFDDHIASAAAHQGNVWDQVDPGQLPLGDISLGIVHLRFGSALLGLVLTEARDFGQAYLTHAWANTVPATDVPAVHGRLCRVQPRGPDPCPLPRARPAFGDASPHLHRLRTRRMTRTGRGSVERWSYPVSG